MFSRPKILFLVSLLFVTLLNLKFNPYLPFEFLIFYHSSSSCNTGTSALPDMYARARMRVRTYQGNARVPVLQLIRYTFMASLYLYRHLLHSIMVFK